MSVGGVIALCLTTYLGGWMHGGIWYGIKAYNEGLGDREYVYDLKDIP